MTNQVSGCGKHNVPLTLYRVSLHRKAQPFRGDFKHLPCGHVATGPEPSAYGILLCEACANGHGFEQLADDQAGLAI
jgi:hypothetical protein